MKAWQALHLVAMVLLLCILAPFTAAAFGWYVGKAYPNTALFLSVTTAALLWLIHRQIGLVFRPK